MNPLFNFFTKLFSSDKKDGKGLISELAENIDRFVNTPEDKKEVLKMAIEDRQNAREMYKNDSWLQKIFALVFLIIWALLLYIMFSHFLTNTIKLDEWQIAFVNTMWGGISAKLSTIIDFLFGSSSTQTNKNK